MHDFASILSAAVNAAHSAGEILVRSRGQVWAREKAPADLVTEADLLVQRYLMDTLGEQFPEFGFVGEEQISEGDSIGQTIAGQLDWQDREFCWIVDPLDGTTNYVHGLDDFCISIALCRTGSKPVLPIPELDQPATDSSVLGVVYAPARVACYTAVRGSGAKHNGHPIRVSTAEQLDQALIAVSLPPRVKKDSPEIERLVAVLCRARGVRRLGSAALNLCYVGEGKLDGYWATAPRIWDVAAGLLIVREAGGVVTGWDGRPFRPDEPSLVAACTAGLHVQLLAVLSQAA